MSKFAGLDDDQLTSHFAHRPDTFLRGVINVQDGPNYVPRQTTRPSSMGSLDALPDEIKYLILDLLDPQSVVRFSSTCLRANTLAISLLSFSDLHQHTPQLLKALSKTRLLHLYSVGWLQACLRSDRCTSCPAFGPFLFLLDGQRCCWECMSRHPTWRAISPSDATKYFGLPQESIRKLPTMRCIPGNYFTMTLRETSKPIDLVSARAVRELSIAENISYMKDALDKLSHSPQLPFAQFLCESAMTEPEDLMYLEKLENTQMDEFKGMAYMLLPTLTSSGVLEHGFWCKGCSTAQKGFLSKVIPAQDLLEFAPTTRSLSRFLFGMRMRARTREDFLEHLKHYHGARITERGLEKVG